MLFPEAGNGGARVPRRYYQPTTVPKCARPEAMPDN
jgi:hypothetical protein